MLRTAISVLVLSFAGCNREATVTPLSAAHIEVTAHQDGMTFHLADDGNVYREVDGGQAWVYHDTVYDPKTLAEAYRTEDEKVFRYDPETNRQFAVRHAFSESFEDLEPGIEGLKALLGESRELWGSITLQSPKAPEVSDYVGLRTKILKGESSFLDARLEPVDERASSGRMSLRCEAPPRTSKMVTCKSSLLTPLIGFKQGEDFWFEADYWFEEGLPLTIADLECEFVSQHPGIRIRLYDDGALGTELKALHKPQYRQPEDRRTLVPKRQWVTIRVHIHLSTTDGRIEIWQDGKQVLDSEGPTFPFRSAVYSSLEVGITAYSEEQGRCVLFVDQIKVASDASAL